MRRVATVAGACALAGVLALPADARAQAPATPQGRAPVDETELVFEREVFSYPTFPRANPFVPLDAGAGGPRFEQLSLIGVVHSNDPGRSVAVLTTGGVSVAPNGTMSPVAGDAYYLRPGERLGNVTIVEVHQDRVVVDVEEFGLTDRRTIRFVTRRDGGIE